MTDVAKYLKENYYPRYAQAREHVPDDKTLMTALEIHASKVIVVYKGEAIAGVGIYLTLDDDTYEHIESFDMSRVDVLSRLLVQTGQNFHFVLLTADSSATIRTGLRIAKALNPKSISWWNPEMTRLHKLNLKEK